jgi:four helix bundle protein
VINDGCFQKIGMSDTLKTFEELECYRLARELRKDLVRIAKALPLDEKFRLTDQLMRASRSVTANIAEGFGRHHHNENLQYCRQSRGSLSECLDHLNAGLDEGLIDPLVYAAQRSNLEHAWKVLNGYIGYLKRCAESGVPNK